MIFPHSEVLPKWHTKHALDQNFVLNSKITLVFADRAVISRFGYFADIFQKNSRKRRIKSRSSISDIIFRISANFRVCGSERNHLGEMNYELAEVIEGFCSREISPQNEFWEPSSKIWEIRLQIFHFDCLSRKDRVKQRNSEHWRLPDTSESERTDVAFF